MGERKRALESDLYSIQHFPPVTSQPVMKFSKPFFHLYSGSNSHLSVSETSRSNMLDTWQVLNKCIIFAEPQNLSHL